MSDWKYDDFRYKGMYATINRNIYEFENFGTSLLIEKIIIIDKFTLFDNLYSQEIKITFSDILKQKINKICYDLNNLHKKNININIYILNDRKIVINNNFLKKFRFEKVINYLEKIEEIYPLIILEKLLYFGCKNNNINNYPKILKNKIDFDIKQIDFKILCELDKDYHDNLIKSLTIDQKLQILKKINKNSLNYTSTFIYNFLSNFIDITLDKIQIKKLVKIIKSDSTFEKIYDNSNIYQQYLNYLSLDEIFKKLKKKITHNRAFEIINYLYTQIELSFDQNIQLINIINEKYQEKDLLILKNKIICKLITNNTDLDNEVYNEISKFEDTTKTLIYFIINKK